MEQSSQNINFLPQGHSRTICFPFYRPKLAAASTIYPPSQISGVAHLLVEGDHEDDEQVAEEPDEDDDREEYGHCQVKQKVII